EPDHGRHRHDPERRLLPVRRRDQGDAGGAVHGPQRHSRSVGRARRRRQRRPVPGLRREPLRHRPHAVGRRRPRHQGGHGLSDRPAASGMSGEESYRGRVLDAALLALSARVAVDEAAERTPESVITELWENHFVLGPRRAAPGPHRLAVDNAVRLPGPPAAAVLARLAPLARKPKRLDEAPSLYRSGRAAPLVVDTGGADRHPGPAAGAGPPGGGDGPVVTAETARLRPLDELFEPAAVDPAVRALAEQITRRLAVRRPARSRDRTGGRGAGRLESLPYRYGSDDIDLDRTIEVLAERPVPEDTDIIVRERLR